MSEENPSRRNFLKLLGFGGMVAAAGMFVKFVPQGISTHEASAQSLGQWALGPELDFPTIHLALLKTGKIMTTPGSGWQNATRFTPPYRVAIYDPNTNGVTPSTTPDDLFCCGFSQLSNGNILIAGGTIAYADNPSGDGLYHGGNFAYEFDVNSTTWRKVSSMAHGRWYPSMGTLPNGKVYVMTGLDEMGIENDLTEIYDPAVKNFTIKYDPNTNNTYCVGQGNNNISGAGSQCYGGIGRGTNPDISYYSRTMIMPSGLVFVAGMRQMTRIWNPSTGVWSNPVKMEPQDIVTARVYGTAVLLPLNNTSSERGRVLIAGGQSKDSPPPAPPLTVLNNVQFVDFNAGTNTAPVRSIGPSMTYARMYADPVILPTGKVIIFGGTSDSNITPVLIPEMFDPVNNTWTVLPAANKGRFYHSASILLPDGRIWVTSGTANFHTFERVTEFFSPSYLFAGTRPVISSQPNEGIYGGTITIPTPDGLDITSVSLLRLGNVTHHFDAEHRCIWLASASVPFVSKSSSNVVVNAPLNQNLAPPGYYMIHILNGSEIPSIAKIIRIGHPIISGPDTTPPIIAISSPSAKFPVVGPPNGVPVTISGHANGPVNPVSSVKVSINSGPQITATNIANNFEFWSASTTINSQGIHKIKAIATDEAGNTSSVEIPITVFFN